MDIIITIIRFPLGLLTIIVVSLFWLLILPIEALLITIAFPIASIFMDRYAIKNSWIGTFPNSLRNLRTNISGIWNWIGND